MSPAWVAPTARAIPWEPMAGVAGCLALVSAVAAYAGAWPVGILGIVAAALAAALVAGLRDPAAALLAAVPTSATRRRGRRLALLAPAGLTLWLACLWSAQLWEAGVGWPLGPVAALSLTGLAVHAWAPEPIALEAGVAAPLLWYAAAWAGGTGSSAAGLLLAWQDHPWVVTTAAATALVIRRNR